MIKIGLKNSLYPHMHFTEHLVGAFGKPPRKSNLNHKTSSLFDPVAQDKTGFHLQWSTHNRKTNLLNRHRLKSRKSKTEEPNHVRAVSRRLATARKISMPTIELKLEQRFQNNKKNNHRGQNPTRNSYTELGAVSWNSERRQRTTQAAERRKWAAADWIW
jgi:hypothetical protein